MQEAMVTPLLLGLLFRPKVAKKMNRNLALGTTSGSRVVCNVHLRVIVALGLVTTLLGVGTVVAYVALTDNIDQEPVPSNQTGSQKCKF